MTPEDIRLVRNSWQAVADNADALERAGDPAAALRQAEGYARLLREEFDTEPAPEVLALVERIRTDPGPATIGETQFPVPDPVRDHDQRRETSGIPSASQRSRHRVRLTLTGMVAGIVTIIAVAAFLSDSTPPDPKRVFVAEFANATGRPELDPVGNMGADWVRAGLLETSMVDVLAPGSFLGIEPDTGSDEQLLELVREARAGTIVTGTFYLEGRSLRIHAHILDTASGQVRVVVNPVTASVDSPTTAVEVLRQRVMGAVASLLDERTYTDSRTELLARPPPNFEAYVADAEARRLIAIGKRPEVLRLRQRAAELDTARTPGLWALLSVQRYAEADSLLKVQQARRDSLTPWFQMNLDHFATKWQGTSAETLLLLHRMYERFPGPLPAFLVAGAELGSGYPERAIEAIERTTPNSGALKGGVGYWQVYTTARHMLGQYRRELRAAMRAAKEKYPVPLLALQFEVRALAGRCRSKALDQRLDAALFLPLLDRTTPADVMLVAGLELQAHCDGRTQRLAAQRAFERAIAWQRPGPATEEQMSARRAQVALLYLLTGQDAQSEKLYRALAAEQPDVLEWRTLLAVFAIRRGDRAEAERIAQELATLDRPYLFGSNHYFHAVIAAQLGRSEQAVNLLRDALAHPLVGVGREELHRDPLLAPLLGFAPFEELLRPGE